LQGLQRSEQNLLNVERAFAVGVFPTLAGVGLSAVNSGAGNASRTGTDFRSVEDASQNPQSLKGKTPAQVRAVFEEARWTEAQLSRTDAAGTKFFETNAEGRTSRMVQWHPGGRHHGSEPYWKVSSPETGTVRVGPQFDQ
jgi:hypothetical protein